MRAPAHVLRQRGQRLIPLATSAAAADVLGRELGIRADNLHKFLHEHTRGAHAARLCRSRHLRAAARMYALHPGDIVLVDEAGMAGTFALDQLVAIAARCGAVVRLLGDDRQLSAVESGGALRLIAHDAGAAELTALYPSYWQAAESVFNARALAGLEPEAAHECVRAQVTTDVYLSLPDGERRAVNDIVAQRLGGLWFGATGEVDDHAAARPMYADRLAAVLMERGYLVDAGHQTPPDNSEMNSELKQPLESGLVEQQDKRRARTSNGPGRTVPSSVDRMQVAVNRHGQLRRTVTVRNAEDLQAEHVPRNPPSWGQRQQPRPMP